MISNIIIIKAPEDIPDHLDRALIENYLATGYHTEVIKMDDRGASIYIGKNPPFLENQLQLFGIKSYAYITAWNPGSEIKDEWWNRMSNLSLELDLHPHCRLLRRGYGIGKNPEWPAEESFLAVDISPEKAVELGRKYRQNAIVVWQEGGVPELWWL